MRILTSQGYRLHYWSVLPLPFRCHYQVSSQLHWASQFSFLLATERDLNTKIKSLNETTHEYCAQVELQFRPKLAFSTHKSFKISVKEWECYPDFPLAFPVWLSIFKRICINNSKQLNQFPKWIKEPITQDWLSGKTNGEPVSVTNNMADRYI